MKPKWIVRIVVGVLLAVAVVLGLMDFLAKSKATETAKAWQGFMDDNVVEFSLDDHIVGSPTVTEGEMNQNAQQLTYVWPGILRDYRVEVSCYGQTSDDGKRFVSKVEGPFND